MSSNRLGREKAAGHEAQARECRRLADLLLTREKAPEAAGELLYAAAKQCINISQDCSFRGCNAR